MCRNNPPAEDASLTLIGHEDGLCCARTDQNASSPGAVDPSIRTEEPMTNSVNWTDLAKGKKIVQEVIGVVKNSRLMAKDAWYKLSIGHLERLQNHDRIKFASLRDATHGKYVEESDTIVINLVYCTDLDQIDIIQGLSLVLVHEASHVTYKLDKQANKVVNDFLLFNEMRAFTLEIKFFRELAGEGIKNPATGKVVRIQGDFEGRNILIGFVNKDQLADHLIVDREYSTKFHVNPEWVFATIDLWGGVKNRWPKTKRLYVVRLLNDFGTYTSPNAARHILRILRSIEARSEWDAMLADINTEFGSLQPLQSSFKAFRSDTVLLNDVLMLQQRWKTPLVEAATV